ncbi:MULTISPECIES: esterase-like activity of phytase family protein [Nostocales]|uniref:Esterase-like activity of phytase family protein n=3 Tax=Nostocales TaxID=1161 RepID=A0A0C1NAF4_9CYAN|nr:esterase-like activity of phytase family protein [Tolypothrix bouteillei]KAF3887560.1 esterase-like activity of phytase family protein [Tolypothrix bouteillei VB521301]
MLKFVSVLLGLQPAWILVVLLNSSVNAAKLIGRAILNADTFAPGLTTGLFKKTNRTTPFVNAQPVQGFSGAIAASRKGTYLVISDNGFGAKANSPDYVLRLYAVEPDFTTGRVFPINIQTGERLQSFNRQSFIELNDRNRKVNFPIVADLTFYPNSTNSVSKVIKENRLLTGGDFDIESFRQINDGTYWMGDEFGPFLLHLGKDGELLDAPVPLPLFLKNDKLNFIKSPDHPDLANLADDEARVTAAILPGSKGFEGLALNSSGTKLYAMLEGALVQEPQKKRLLIYEFDLTSKQYSGKTFSYLMEDSSHAIGELTAINDREFIVIERDNTQGDPNKPAFKTPAQFKRLYKINITKMNKEGFLEKELLVDLLKIRDPKGIGGQDTVNGVFAFPFVTIETVLPVDDRTLLVVNDNNYADTRGRNPKQIDNTEFILIKLDR